MKKLLLTIVGLSLFTFASSQNLITVQNADTVKFYKSHTDAFTNAVNGDTLYFPGGKYSISTLSISKKLHIYGVGHYPDSTLATGITEFDGTVRFLTGSDSSLISGVKISGIYLGSSTGDQEIHDLTIERCYLSSLYLSYNGSTSTPSSDIYIRENVILSFYGGYATDVYVEKNFLHNSIRYFAGNGINTFRNNVFLYNYGPLSSVSNCNFENNIFLTNETNLSSTNSAFNNNIFKSAMTFTNTNTGSDNVTNQTLATIFVSSVSNSFSYSYDYHLNAIYDGANAGSDGTEIGLYGTTTPYKEGAVPAHPHIREQSISAKTDGSGNINVSIKVSGQKK